MRTRTALAAAALLAAGFLLGWQMVKTTAQEGKSATDTGLQTLDTRIGKLTFTHGFANGYLTKETVQMLYDERDFQRACQAYLWAQNDMKLSNFVKLTHAYGYDLVLEKDGHRITL